MCGIFGYYDYSHRRRNIDEVEFNTAVDCLSHRGPDNKGIYVENGVGLGHRRLSIIDLSENGSQPMCSPDRKVWITYNGEIYNYLELKKILIKRNYQFRSTSDTEVLLYSYIEWGQECTRYIRGIFAFAIWDTRNNELWLARDHMGVKPLFYVDHEGILYFSSEIQALLKISTIPKDPDLFGLDSYFTFGFIPAPQTGYQHIKQLLPGHSMILNPEKKLKIQEYWELPLEQEKRNIDEMDLLEEMESIFDKAVNSQLVSDAPLGIFLSAGTDSFAIARSIKNLNKQDITAFSIGFSNKEFDELEKAKLAAQALDIKLISKTINDIDTDILNQIARHSQEPFADSSSIPVYILSEMASEHIKVALSGDGADELLGGYSVYRANRYAEMFRRIPNFIKNGFIKPISNWIPDKGGKYTYREKVKRFLYGAEKGKFQDHASWRVILSDELKQQLYSREFYNEVKEHNPLDPYIGYILKAKKANCADLDSCLYADLKFYLPNDMLVKIDRMSMANHLEVRVPFLDLEMVKFCWSLPTKFKIKNGKLKYILKKLIYKDQPVGLRDLPKSGFNVYLKDLDAVSSLKGANFFSSYHKFMYQYLIYIFKSSMINNYNGKPMINP